MIVHDGLHVSLFFDTPFAIEATELDKTIILTKKSHDTCFIDLFKLEDLTEPDSDLTSYIDTLEINPDNPLELMLQITYQVRDHEYKLTIEKIRRADNENAWAYDLTTTFMGKDGIAPKVTCKYAYLAPSNDFCEDRQKYLDNLSDEEKTSSQIKPCSEITWKIYQSLIKNPSEIPIYFEAFDEYGVYKIDFYDNASNTLVYSKESDAYCCNATIQECCFNGNIEILLPRNNLSFYKVAFLGVVVFDTSSNGTYYTLPFMYLENVENCCGADPWGKEYCPKNPSCCEKPYGDECFKELLEKYGIY